MIDDGTALATAHENGWLGDKQTIATLLQELSGGTLIQFGQASTEDEAKAIIEGLPGDCESVADILLGGLPGDYKPVAAWNQPGFIDVFLRAQFPEQLGEETDPMRVVASAVALYLREVLEFVKTLPDDAGQELWQPDLDAITERWVNTFIGVPQEA